MHGTALKKHLRHVLLWLFDKNNEITGTVAAQKMQAVYGEDAMKEWACRKWLKRFREGEKDLDDLEDLPRSDRPSEFEDDSLKRLIEEDPKVTIRELASRLNSSVGTVQRHLHAIGFVRFFTSLEARFKVPKLGNWVPHLLSAKNKQVRLRIATELRNRHELGLLLLDSIVTGDEKWVLCVNVIRRHQWVPKDGASPPTAKPGLHPNKVLLTLFWDTEGKLKGSFFNPDFKE